MSKHKKQHYIPKCYLKAWCDSACPRRHTPYIWVFEKESKIGRKKSPENIFHETDLYTIWNEKGGRNLEIEHGLSGLERQFSSIRIKKIARHRELDEIESFIIVVFVAAMHARTKSQLEHLANQWRRPLEMMDQLSEQIKSATEEEKKRIANFSPLSSSGDKNGFTHEQVKEMVADPVKTMLLPLIRTQVPLLAKLDMAILHSDATQEFITSDSPCVWFDPEGYKRPPFYSGPALMYKTIEITLPVSPTECIYLNRQGLSGYQYVPEDVVMELNRRIRFNSSEYYVVNKEFVDDFWFDPGVEPKDSWKNQQNKKKAKN